MKDKEEIVTSSNFSSKASINITTHLYPEDPIDTVHVIKTTHNFPDHRVEPGAQTTTCYDTRMHFIWFKIDLSNIIGICY
jgi:hypothetical protein